MDDLHLVPLSALQHFAYCPRQCALIHLEQAWVDNRFTAQGQQLHQRVDSGKAEKRKGIRFERGVWVNAPTLGVTGKLDLLEIEPDKKRYCPVEYKRGKPKKEDWDRVQLCAQALCLEEMLGVNIHEGALWYWQTRHREAVMLVDDLRYQTLEIIDKVKALFAHKQTPRSPAVKKRCQACSLKDVCQPDWLRKDHSQHYVDSLFNLNDDIKSS